MKSAANTILFFLLDFKNLFANPRGNIHLEKLLTLFEMMEYLGESGQSPSNTDVFCIEGEACCLCGRSFMLKISSTNFTL
jgi:hypothetical protein